MTKKITNRRIIGVSIGGHLMTEKDEAATPMSPPVAGWRVERMAVDEPGEWESDTIYEYRVMSGDRHVTTCYDPDDARKCAAVLDLLDAARWVDATAKREGWAGTGLLELRAAIAKAEGVR